MAGLEGVVHEVADVGLRGPVEEHPPQPVGPPPERSQG